MKVEKHYKTLSSIYPERLHVKKIGDFYEISLHENIKEREVEIHDKKVINYESDLTISRSKCDNYDELKGAFVKLKYNQDQEFAIVNKGIVNIENEEYKEYRSFVEEIKTFVNTLKG
jgi:predicted transcriptional regulator with HTH domain